MSACLLKFTWCFLLLPALVATSYAQMGTINGVVLNEHGTPEPGVQVVAAPIGGAILKGMLPHSETNEAGRFSIASLGFGAYGIFTSKPQAGYPDTTFTLYSGNVFPKVTLSNERPIAQVRVTLSKAGILVGKVEDKNTGDLLRASFTVRRVALPRSEMEVELSPEYRILLPPQVDLFLQVSAPGYKAWTYFREFGKSLTIASGELRIMNIKLTRVR